MKMNLLTQCPSRCDGLLPPSFDLVVLGKKERNMVINCGKNPDRTEGDIGEDGKPANTEYLPPDMPSVARDGVEGDQSAVPDALPEASQQSFPESSQDAFESIQALAQQ
jgi:hypothetical protein